VRGLQQARQVQWRGDNMVARIRRLTGTGRMASLRCWVG